MTVKKRKYKERLTQKQERFANLVVSGESYSDSYRRTYSVKNMTDNAIRVEAHNLAKREIVANHIRKLKKDLEDENLWSRKMSVKALMNAYKRAEQEGQTGSMVSAIRELNAMHGYNEPAKVDITSGGKSLVKEADELTDEELERIIERGS